MVMPHRSGNVIPTQNYMILKVELLHAKLPESRHLYLEKNHARQQSN